MKTNSTLLFVLAIIVIVGFFALLFSLLFLTVPETNKSLLDIITGVLTASVGSIIGYYFGSSIGSKSKDDTINNMKDGKI